MNQCSRAFVLTGLVVAILLAMHMLPTLYVNDIELRHVNILSDVLPEPYGTDGATAEVVAPPAPPAPVAVADSDSTAARVEEVHPDGVTMIADYSAGEAGGMDHFTTCLPVRGRLGVRCVLPTLAIRSSRATYLRATCAKNCNRRLAETELGGLTAEAK